MVGTDRAGELNEAAGPAAVPVGRDLWSVPKSDVHGAARTRGPALQGNGSAEVCFALATSTDAAAIRRLLRENPTRGAISVSFEREPRYFVDAAGAPKVGRVFDPLCHPEAAARATADQTIVAYENGRLVCMGRCSVRPRYLNGERHCVGYLGELRLDRIARRGVEILRGGYQFFREVQRDDPADFYFTSIAADNERARRVLEHGLPGLPRYEFLTEFVTLLISVGRAGTPLPAAAHTECASFFNAAAARHQLAAHWSDADLAAIDARIAVRDTDGRIIAATALWDQRAWRQTVVRGYSRTLTLARPMLNLVAAVTGAPHLPRVGAIVPTAFLSPLAIAPGHESRLPELIGAAFGPARGRGVEMLTLGLAGSDPLLAVVRRHFRCREYHSRLYRVSWPDETVAGVGAPGPASARPATVVLDGRTFRPEVALL